MLKAPEVVLYRMRLAAPAWEDCFCGATVGRTDEQGRCGARAARVLVHGDDFVIAGPRAHLERFKRKMQDCYEVKICSLLVCWAGDSREIVILGCQVRWQNSHVDTEAGDSSLRPSATRWAFARVRTA